MSTEITINQDIVEINVTEEVVVIEAPSGAYPLPTGVYSVFGRTGNVVAQEGDYNLTQLGDVTITSPSTGQVLKYNGTTWVNGTDTDTGLTSVGLSMPSAFSVANSPLTANGTLSVTGAGTTLEYVRGDGSLATFPTIAQEAQRLITEVYNSTGATLTKGSIVYINGGQGNLPTVTKAIATGDATSAQTYGVVQSDITNMNNGFVVAMGSLTNLDTQAYPVGTQLYLSGTTAGAWTSVKPYAPIHLVYVGIVVRSHPTQGIVEIRIQNGYELDELHDVSAQNPTNGDILQYVAATDLWTKVAGTTTNIAEGTNLYYTDARSRAAFSESVTGLDYNSTTGVLSTTSGFGIPTTASQSTWNTAYNRSLTSAAVTGTTTKTLTLNQQDGGTITASWTDDNTDAVTSVFGRTGAVTAQSGDYTTTQVTEGTNLYFTDARARAAITLTTTGTSGAATYSGGTLNIPQYQGVLTNPVTGTGTTNTLPKFTGTSAIGDSNITDNGSLINLNSSTRINSGQDGLRIGADSNGVINSANTSKRGRLNVPQYGNPASLPIAILQGATDAASNSIQIGGTQGGYALAADVISFFIGATYNATTATEVARFASNGALGIGSTSLAGYNLRVNKTITGSTSGIGIQSAGAIQSDVSDAAYFSSGASTQAATFTLTDVAHFIANQGTIGAGSTITKQYGYRVAASLIGATNNYAFFSDIPSGTNRWNLYMNGTAANYMAGSLGIGTTSFVFGGGTYNLNLTKNITGTVVAGGMNIGSIVNSDVTSAAIGLNVQVTTAAAAFTLNQLRHISVNQTTLGAGSSVSNQYGIYVDQITNGSSNFGFFGNIPAGTNRWNIYMAGTANNFLAGSLGIGATGLTGYSLRVSRSITGSIDSYGIMSDGQIQSDVTTSTDYFRTNATTQAASFTLFSLNHYNAGQGTIGAGSTVTNQTGFIVASNMIGGTNNYGFRGLIPAGTNRWNIYMDGTADNYLAGKLGIGSTSLSNRTLHIGKTITGGTVAFAVLSNGVVQSDVTSQANNFTSVLTTAAAAFTLPTYYHFIASQGTIGSTSAVTNQYGFAVENTLTGATNNYGFFGNIASGTNRWNLYMAGTAANYMAGDLGIGSTNPDFFSRGYSKIFGVFGSSNASIGINTNTGSSCFLQLGVNNTRTFQLQSNATETLLGTGTATPLIFTIAFNERARIESNGNFGIGTGASINASAKVQIDSTTSGFLPPRMTTTQKLAIGTPAAGLMVYDTTLNQMSYYNGTLWINF
jgi:hypothetical protein